MKPKRPVTGPNEFVNSKNYDEDYLDEEEEWYERYGSSVSGRNRKGSDDRARAKVPPKQYKDSEWDE